jgi:HNH endonuclease
MTNKRKPISKKTRFEIFKRDDFTCQYCGGQPPKVILQIDHILAVSKGGKNNEDNLVTSCQPCNLGKMTTPLSVIPQSLADKAVEAREREEQLLGYQQILQARFERIERESWQIIKNLGLYENEGTKRDWFRGTKVFVEKLGYYEVLEASEIAMKKNPWSDYKRFAYFCGICWRKIKEPS